MRHLGELDSADKASAFQDFMLTNGVPIHVDEETDHWSIWVKEEDHLEKASEEFDKFCSNPDDSKYYETRKNAEAIRQQEAKRIKDIADKRIDIRNRWRKPLLKACPVSLALIVISVVVFLGMEFGGQKRKASILSTLCFANLEIVVDLDLEKMGEVVPHDKEGFAKLLPKPIDVIKTELSRGEFWRLITPVFMHFGPLHILFNMMWVNSLGTLIEFKNGPLKMIIMVLLIAVISNFAQYYFTAEPIFGGMSGVVSGLFGFVWMKSKYFPGSGYYMHPNTVFFVIVWLLLCTTGAAGPIANHAHGFGLASGVALAFVPYFDS